MNARCCQQLPVATPAGAATELAPPAPPLVMQHAAVVVAVVLADALTQALCWADNCKVTGTEAPAP